MNNDRFRIPSICYALVLIIGLLIYPVRRSALAGSLDGIFQSPSSGSTYYISPAGSDSNPGTISQPWRSLEKAGTTAQAGDVVYFRGGDYHGQLKPVNSGDLSNGYIIFKAYPGEQPVIIHDATWSRAIDIDGVSFIEVNGLTAIAAGANGPGIGINNAHHIRVINCTARDSATSGIATTNGIDYITIVGNLVYGNSNVGQYNGSGISIWNSGGPIYDSQAGHHIIIRNNLIYDNRNLTSNPTDGNGIILDNNDQGESSNQQMPSTLVANNVIFHNGGRCIQALNSSNADIINNTCYHNLETSKIAEGCGGEITLQRNYDYTSAINLRVENNIVFGRGGTCSNGSKPMAVFQVWCIAAGCPQFNSDYNLWFNGSTYALGENDLKVDPRFINPSLDAQTSDFHLNSDSPAIDTGTGAYSTILNTDYDGIDRPQFEQYDIGAYEYHNDQPVESNQIFIPMIYQG